MRQIRFTGVIGTSALPDYAYAFVLLGQIRSKQGSYGSTSENESITPKVFAAIPESVSTRSGLSGKEALPPGGLSSGTNLDSERISVRRIGPPICGKGQAAASMCRMDYGRAKPYDL